MKESGIELSSLTPAQFGFLPQFRDYRQVQLDALENERSSKRRFILHSMPTGSGKSLFYMTAAMMAGDRTLILTATKGLQDQILKDFSSLGVKLVKGMRNFICIDSPSQNCDHGKCRGGMFCEYKRPTLGYDHCLYYKQIDEAKRSRIVVTNYHYWVSVLRYGDTDVLGSFDRIVLDEAHLAPEILLDCLKVKLSQGDCKAWLEEELPDFGSNRPKWRGWALQKRGYIARWINDLKEKLDIGELIPDSETMSELRELQVIFGNLDSVAKMPDTYHIRRENDAKEKLQNYHFEPTVVSQGMAEDFLFRFIGKVIMVSATIVPMTAELIGVNRVNFDYFDYPSGFPLENRRVTVLRSLSINYRTVRSEYLQFWLPKIDRIISERLDRKGIIHTRSFKLQQLLLQNSAYKLHMVTHKSGESWRAVKHFVKVGPPSILVSPSVSVGFDFPYELCSYQIVVKVPFPNFGEELFQVRRKDDPRLPDYMTALDLVQTCGRGVRYEDDACETFIVDDAARKFIGRAVEFLPSWFLEALIYSELPPPPIRVPMRGGVEAVKEEIMGVDDESRN